jgi:predicted metal-dependent hydrolase
LPYGSAGVEPVGEDPLPPEETLDRARELLELGRPFSAHEVLEARWKAGPDEERALWQGLAQMCVGLTHEARGNATGAVTLLERGAANLEGYSAGVGPTYGLDLASLIACARSRAGGS